MSSWERSTRTPLMLRADRQRASPSAGSTSRVCRPGSSMAASMPATVLVCGASSSKSSMTLTRSVPARSLRALLRATPLDLARQLVAVVAGMRPEGHAAADPRGAARRTGAGAARALLAVQLGGGVGHLGPGLGVVGALALVGQVVAHGLVEGLLVHGLGEQGGGKFHRSLRLARTVVEFRRCHFLPRSVSVLPDPPGGYRLGRIKTIPFLWPGTLPAPGAGSAPGRRRRPSGSAWSPACCRTGPAWPCPAARGRGRCAYRSSPSCARSSSRGRRGRGGARGA